MVIILVSLAFTRFNQIYLPLFLSIFLSLLSGSLPFLVCGILFTLLHIICQNTANNDHFLKFSVQKSLPFKKSHRNVRIKSIVLQYTCFNSKNTSKSSFLLFIKHTTNSLFYIKNWNYLYLKNQMNILFL